MNFSWNNNSHALWLEKENLYMEVVISTNQQLEQELENFPVSKIANMSGEEFFDFLYDKYFVWKYTAKNRLATTRTHLLKHKENLEELNDIKKSLVSFDAKDIKKGLEITTKIKGLGTAGASGLLSLLYPAYYGTVDQFVVLRLQESDEFENDQYLHKMRPQNLTIQDGVYLISILQKKAEELNRENNTTYWTPRKIDKVLWALNR